MREPLVISPVENYVSFKRKNIICIFVLATEMTGTIHGSSFKWIKMILKYPGTDHVVTVMNSEGKETNEAGRYLIYCLP
jgi:hypothetical protein